MPATILNLKFKGNKSFVAFSNLSDTDSLTRTWKVCTKVAAYLEQGQRLENLSWRLWHLQNLIVDTDNAKSKREFRKLSKSMGDKLDKEKGRSIEELQAPGFHRNQSVEKIRQRAAEKERIREQSKAAGGQTGLNRMQFTFSVDVDPPSPSGTSQPPKKPDFKPSAEFRDVSANVKREQRERDNYASKARSAVLPRHAMEELREETTTPTPGMSIAMDLERDKPLTQRGRKPLPIHGNDHNDVPFFINTSDLTTSANAHGSTPASIRFPSLFSNDFGPSALLFATPTSTHSQTYGEGLGLTSSAGLSVLRPTIELPLDEILGEEGTPSSLASYSQLPPVHGDYHGHQPMDVDAKPSFPRNGSDVGNAAVYRLATKRETRSSAAAAAMTVSVPSSNRNGPSTSVGADPATPTTATLVPGSHVTAPTAASTPTTLTKPSLSIRTSATAPPRTAAPSATLHFPPANTAPSTSASASASASATNFANNTAPGGQKAECVNCGATHTPLWRRGLNDELNCNACGLYCKLHKRPRPKTLRSNHGEGRNTATVRSEPVDVMAQCYNCHTTATPLWRKDDEGRTVCNACGLYYKLHGSSRPISMKSDVIRKRSRHDARRIGPNGEPTNEDSSSASPGDSTRPSPAQRSPTLAPDSSTAQLEFPEHFEFSTWNNNPELMSDASSLSGSGPFSVSGSYTSAPLPGVSSGFPGPYHPDVINQAYNAELPFAPSDEQEQDEDEHSGEPPRVTKRRRTSILSVASSASEPPSSAASYSSYDYSSMQSSVTSLSNQSILDFGSPYGGNTGSSNSDYLRGAGTFWSSIKPQDSPHFHPPMLQEENGMDFYHPPMLPSGSSTNSAAEEAIFREFIHPPMLRLGEDSPMHGYSQLPGQQSAEGNSGGDRVMFGNEYESFNHTFGV